MAKIATTEADAKDLTSLAKEDIARWLEEVPSHKAQFMAGHLTFTVTDSDKMREVLERLISPYYIDKISYGNDTAYVHMTSEWSDPCDS